MYLATCFLVLMCYIKSLPLRKRKDEREGGKGEREGGEGKREGGRERGEEIARSTNLHLVSMMMSTVSTEQGIHRGRHTHTK